MTWEWVNGVIFIFVWTMPLSKLEKSDKLKPMIFQVEYDSTKASEFPTNKKYSQINFS